MNQLIYFIGKQSNLPLKTFSGQIWSNKGIQPIVDNVELTLKTLQIWDELLLLSLLAWLFNRIIRSGELVL